MTRNLTRLLLLLQLGVALLGGAGLGKLVPALPTWLQAMAGLALVLLVRALNVANNFRLAARHVSTPPAATLGWRRYLGMIWKELWASLFSASWYMPFGRLSAGPVDFGNPLPVLLIHGYGCNSGYWRPLSRVLRAERISFYAPDLEPLLGDIDAYVPQLGAALDLLCQATGRSRVVLIGHSMGGLAAAAWLRAHGDARIAKLITIGTPHHGTALAHFAPGVNSRQMRRSAGVGSTGCSTWLQALQPVLRAGSVPLVSLYSTHDNIVAPATSAHVVGAKNIAFDDIGHVRLASAPEVIAVVLAELRASEAMPTGPVQTGRASVSMPVTQAPTSTQEKPSC